MTNKGVVFDFNGTLFWDTELQNRSWDHFLTAHGFKLSEEEKYTRIHGINAKDTFEYLFQRSCSPSEVDELTEEKEVIYRQMCLDGGIKWAPGAVDLIEFLLENGVKIAIATAAGKKNVEFYIEQFDLLKYFKCEHIIYNDGSVPGKPNPDLFNKAIEMLHIPPNRVTIFEDSLAGVEAAKRSGAGNIYIVNGNRAMFKDYNYPIISHFNQVDRNTFK